MGHMSTQFFAGLSASNRPNRPRLDGPDLRCDIRPRGEARPQRKLGAHPSHDPVSESQRPSSSR
jgi:hypothetical protein